MAGHAGGGSSARVSHHAAGRLRDPGRHAEWLARVRRAAWEDGYPLVINARVDVFLGPFLAVAGPVSVLRLPQAPSLPELAALGVARVSWGPLLHRDAMARFADQLAALQE